MNLYLLQYNNYYNRIFKKLDTVAEYVPYLCAGVVAKNPIPNVNFIPNDGVVTEQIINWDGDSPDYVIVVDENTNINSRWFVIESIRTRTGQFKLSLYRDLFADYWENIMSAPMFVEKGYVGVNDPFIFNDEQITVNQIKQNEVPLKDSTGMAWVVGYCAPHKENENLPNITYGVNDGWDIESPTMEDLDFYQYLNKTYKVLESYQYDFIVKTNPSGTAIASTLEYKFTDAMLEEYTQSPYSVHPISGYCILRAKKDNTKGEIIKNNIVNNIPSGMKNHMLANFGLVEGSNYTDLKKYEGLVVKIGNQRYGIHITTNANGDDLPRLENQSGLAVKNTGYYNDWVNLAKSFEDTNGSQLLTSMSINDGQNSFNTVYTYQTYTPILVPITSVSGLAFEFPANRKVLSDAPYCMFCMPYGKLSVIYPGDSSSEFMETTKSNALSVASGIAASIPGVVYDIQLLPYCPISRVRESVVAGMINITRDEFGDWEKGKDYLPIEGADTFMFFADVSQGKITIDAPAEAFFYSSALDYKVHMLTSMVRLCSPNYNGVFEFNPYKNRGFKNITVDYTYKPYQPYIHLAPNWGGLYGSDFKDARGLICGGDFSLPIMTEQWKSYQIQNKNYQEQFNRQIENMEVQHKYARQQENWSIATGVAQGAVSGAAAGMYVGGGYGAIAGAVIGGAMSGAGGAADKRINEALRTEALDYTKDQFGFQLDNIKALPNSLTRISSLNANNKIFPFVEIYRCTETENIAVRNKLIYNGFTIGRIDTLQNMITNKPVSLDKPGYFKGQIIRLEDIGDDFHVTNSIANELYKGVYI